MEDKHLKYTLIGNLLSYPEPRVITDLERLRELVPEEGEALSPLGDFLEAEDLKHVEELFTRSFDLNPSCCLEIGWHLFGEDYQRGEFLVNMRQSLAEEGLMESVELPDHISHCLFLLTRLEAEDAEAFVRRFILPGLDKVLEGVEPENPYTCVIEVLRRLLESEFGKADTSLNRDKARLVELPLLNSVLHYNNTEDLEGLKKKR